MSYEAQWFIGDTDGNIVASGKHPKEPPMTNTSDGAEDMSNELIAEVAKAERELAQAYRDEADACRARSEAEVRINACLKVRNAARKRLDDYIGEQAA